MTVDNDGINMITLLMRFNHIAKWVIKAALTLAQHTLMTHFVLSSLLFDFILTISRKIFTLKRIFIGDYPRVRKLSIFRWVICVVGLRALTWDRRVGELDEKPEITSALIKFRFNALIYLSLFSETQFLQRTCFRSYHHNFHLLLLLVVNLLTHHTQKLCLFYSYLSFSGWRRENKQIIMSLHRALDRKLNDGLITNRHFVNFNFNFKQIPDVN